MMWARYLWKGVFPLDRGLSNQKLLYDTCVDVKRKTTKTLLVPSISIKTKISQVIFYIRPCLFHHHPKIRKYDLRPVKLKQELSRTERIIAILPLAFQY
jgi:hypothetical protein